MDNQTEQKLQSIETESPQEETPIQPSRAKLDFSGDETVTDTNDETERKLLQLDSQGDDYEGITEASTDTQTTKVSQEESTQPEQKIAQADSGSLPDLAELDLPEDLGLEAKNEEQKEVAPEFKKFAEDFEKYMGMPIEQFKASQQEAIQYVNQVKAEQAKVEATKLLSNEWGVEATEVESRLEQVQERFNKYPEDMRKRLDSVEGAKLIWAKIEQESASRLNKQVPQFQRSRSQSTASPKAMFTQAEIDKMSPDVYARNADRILRAYQLGLVQ